MKENVLKAKPRIWVTLLDIFLFAAGEGLAVFVFLFFRSENHETFGEKLFQTILVCVFIIATLFLLFGLVCSIRSIIPRAILTVDDEKVILERKKEIFISDIEDVKTDGKKLKIVSKNGDRIMLNKNDVNIPLETIAYAINVRRED